MVSLDLFFLRVVAVILFALTALPSQAAQLSAKNPPILMQDLGKGTAPLVGPCQFHLGDNPAWATPGFDDSSWKSIATDRPWGVQGYDRYTGYAWYRCHLELTPAPGISSQFSLLLQRVFDAEEVYWNGALVGRNGRLDPYRIWYYAQPPRIYALGAAQQGVLAVRVWKAPLYSDDSGQEGGFEFAPLIGSPAAIATAKAALDYQWLRSRQFLFGESLLYTAIGFLSLLAWWRHHDRNFLLWMAIYALAPPALLLLLNADLRWPYSLVVGIGQPLGCLDDISLWFLLVWLLPLREHARLCRLTRILAVTILTNMTLDGVLVAIHWGPRWMGYAQIADDVSAVIYTLLEVFPLVLIGFALIQRKRFDFARWLVAILALFDSMVFIVHNAAKQGRQYSNWTLADKMDRPLFAISGSAITLQTIAEALLLAAIVYAVYSRLREDQRRKEALEREKIELMRTREQMRHFAEHDDLTGLWNHRIIMERLRSEVERSHRDGTQVSVILADIDHFKNINDTFGHPVGDLVLKEVSAIFMNSVRTYDWVGRYGGEEFLLILPGSDFDSACLRAEDLRIAVQDAHILDGETRLHVTSSFGVASGFSSGSTAEEIIRVVDAALYRAKAGGRNCVIATDMNLTVTEE